MTTKTLARRRRRSQRNVDMSRPPQIYGYARVSTLQQAREGVSLAEQERQIRARCALGEDGKAWELTRLFVENGVSASVPFAERLAGAELTAVLQPGDHIIAAKLDRMFRSAEDAHSTVNRLKAMGVHLWLLDFPGDCSGNGVATLLLGVLSSVAQWERERIAERISEGKAQARLQNKFMGGARQFGFEAKPDDEGKLVPIPWEQDAIAKIKAMREADHTLREIADVMRAQGHAISYEGVRRVLAREAALAPTEEAAA